MELGILRWKRVGFCVNFWVVGGKCWVGSLWEGGEELQEASAKLGGEFWRVQKVFPALVCYPKKRPKTWFSGWISEEERCSLSLGIALWNRPLSPE